MEIERELDSDGANGRFFHLENEKRYSLLEFLLTDSKRLVIKHTEVSPEKTGQGFGKSLIDAVSQWSKENGFKILPVCPYAKNILVNNPEKYGDILV